MTSESLHARPVLTVNLLLEGSTVELLLVEGSADFQCFPRVNLLHQKEATLTPLLKIQE